jgi:threonylcarbamoyladenosine tRNA methylthiotransferase MtaB
VSATCAIATLGCKTNQFESAAMEELLVRAGYRPVPFDEGADLVVINTCTVTAATDAQSRNLIRRARRINSRCRIVVTGCYAQIDPQALADLPGVGVVLGNEEKRHLIDFIAAGEGGIHVGDIRRHAGPAMSLSTFSGRSRAFVQIQNGCDAFCSYCIIPHARGPSRSVPADEVVRQVGGLAGSGFAEVVLTGIHVGLYGRDLEPPCSLLDLAGRIERETALRRLRLGSMEPLEISPELIGFVADSPLLCPHFHIPLQSGDDAVLRRMNRHYGADFFRSLSVHILRRVPDAAIGCDVITGFPGETEQEFENTRRLLEELPVTHLHVFPFSRRPGTPAADMPGQVPGRIAKDRATLLREMGERKLEKFSRSFIGRTLEVVVEGKGRAGERKGLTGNYLSVFFAGTDDLEGKLVPIIIEDWTDKGLRGRIV